MTLLSLAVCAVATWRLAYMIVNEQGPFRVFERIRDLTDLGGLLSCVKCSTLWTAALILVLWFIGGSAQAFVYLLALSGAGLMLASFAGVDR